MIAAAWAWALAGIAVVLVLGFLLVALLGVAGMPGDFLRRLRHSASGERTDQGGAVPDEVPAATAEEAAHMAEDERPR